jgi:FHS family glucose/mannose:H+ symporter-like MFS transporter
MHLSFLLSGAGTLLLAATLPVYAERWHLLDSQSGILLAAQFCGLSVGSIAIWRHLRRTLLSGYALAATGFALLLVASTQNAGFAIAVPTFFLLGLGLGQITVSINLLAALRYADPAHRSSALSALNFTWSAGAVLSPLLAGFYLSHLSLEALLLTFVAFAIILLAALALLVRPIQQRPASAEATLQSGIALNGLLYFCVAFLLYGGLEATLGGWLSTYSLRYTGLSLAAAAYCTTAMWAAFAAGRALAAIILRRVSEQAVRFGGILLTGSAATALRHAHTGRGIAICAALIGLGIAAFFPITFSRLIARGPTPRQAGVCTAMIGLGSAIFPYLTGLASSHLSSLRSALIAPILIAAALLLLCIADRTPSPAA